MRQIRSIKDLPSPIKDKYEALSDGKHLVIFNPLGGEVDQWGFEILKVDCATKRDNKIRYIVEKKILRRITFSC